MGQWLYLYFVKHYKTTVAGLAAIAAGATSIAVAVLEWKPESGANSITAGLLGIITGVGLVFSKDAGATDAVPTPPGPVAPAADLAPTPVME